MDHLDRLLTWIIETTEVTALAQARDALGY